MAVRERALQVIRRNEESLALVRTILADQQGLLKTRPHEAYRFRICEATNLWQLNRAGEAVEKLLAIRTELLGLPDSSLLASCVQQLSSAEIVLGDLEQA